MSPHQDMGLGRVGGTTHLDGGVVFIHEVVLDELDGQGTLPHASSAHHHELILRHRSSRDRSARHCGGLLSHLQRKLHQPRPAPDELSGPQHPGNR